MKTRCLAWLSRSLFAAIVLAVSIVTPVSARAADALTDQERHLDCPGVRAAVADVAVQIKRNDAIRRKETATPPTSLAQMLKPAPPTAAVHQAKALRHRATLFAKLATDKGCNRLDNMTKSRLGGALKPVLPPPAERCDVRGELSLQDCAEDVAKWRCRGEAAKGRAYLVCLEQTAERIITASGYDVTILANYEPGCGDVTSPATCSVFANNRRGPETKWCKRVSETALEVCQPPKGTPTIASAVSGPYKATKPVAATPAATAAGTASPNAHPNGTTCQPLPCRLGTSCNRLCGLPD